MREILVQTAGHGIDGFFDIGVLDERFKIPAVKGNKLFHAGFFLLYKDSKNA
jgi:hypothetical protein